MANWHQMAGRPRLHHGQRKRGNRRGPSGRFQRQHPRLPGRGFLLMLSPMMQCAGRIRVKGCPFGAPDGVSSSFQLADRHGHAVTKDVRIQSIHQTDWQGRVELSSEARTNYAPYSEDFTNWTLYAGSCSPSSVPAPSGEGYYSHLIESATAGYQMVVTDIDQILT